MHRLIPAICHREREPASDVRKSIQRNVSGLLFCYTATDSQQVQKDAIEIIADDSIYTDSFRNNRSMKSSLRYRRPALFSRKMGTQSLSDHHEGGN
jgi:hypothetical protein